MALLRVNVSGGWIIGQWHCLLHKHKVQVLVLFASMNFLYRPYNVCGWRSIANTVAGGLYHALNP